MQTAIVDALSWVILLFKDKVQSNGKPMALHSVRVGSLLDYVGEGENIIIAGLLHDVIEDCGIQEKEIEEKFGKTVSKLVLACSYNTDLHQQNTDLAHDELFKRAKKYGRDAVIIKVADIVDNLANMQGIAADHQERLRKRGQQWLIAGRKYLPTEHLLISELENLLNQHIHKE